MIARLAGKLVKKSALHVIVDVHGVGYRVFVPLSTFYHLPEVGEPVTLEIYTAVREEAIHLFGFQNATEKAVFEQLLAVSKIGPKVAIGILSGISTAELADAVESGDVDRMSAIPGVGAKTAERIIVELRGKLGRHAAQEPAALLAADGDGASRQRSESVTALINLGYKRQNAEQAVKKSLQELGDGAAIEDVIRAALRQL